MARLEQLQVEAAAALEEHFTAPQRYGTAFHVTPPHLDVRQLPAATFEKGAHVVDTFEALSAGDQKKLGSLNVHDPYLVWQLAHMGVLPPRIIRVQRGQKKIEQLASSATQHASQLVWIVVEAGAVLTLYDTLQGSDISLRRMVVVQHENSVLNFWGVRGSNVFADEKVIVYLQGSSAQAHVTHLVAGSAAHQSDIDVAVYHQAPETVSDIKVRTAAAEQAHVLYRGLIDVARTAGGTQGYQQGKALMLSPKAVVDMLPKLEIATNNVRCSHGVSTTHLDDAALFYMRSRGIPIGHAKQLAIRGFFQQALDVPAEIVPVLEGMIETAYAHI